MRCRLAVALAFVSACGPSLTARERMVARVFADARRDEARFAAHFDPAMSPEVVRSLRASFARESAPKFEQGDGPVCVRAYWGEWVIDHSVYLYLRPSPGGFVVTEVASDAGSWAALGELAGTEHRASPASESDRCVAANAAPPRD